LTLNGNRGCVKQKEHNDIKSNQLSRSQKKQSTDRGRVIPQRREHFKYKIKEKGTL